MKLTRAWKNFKTNIVQIVAPGGVGKSQLVKKWRESLLDKPNHGGAVRAFDWSFYSQGTQQQASADEFFDKALRWFGESKPESYKNLWEKGERLGGLVKQERTLLILDGLEPLQHPPGPLHGQLSDPSLQALLRGLAEGNPGLCIVTTREAVADIEHLNKPSREVIDLTTLDETYGAELLTLYGVTGTDEELRQASADVRGHSLALILLATYLQLKCGGDVTRRSEALLFDGHERYAAHAHKVMASYEAWLERDDHIGRAAVAILHLMGLFNRPVDSGCLAALRAQPPIAGLTEAFFLGDPDTIWNRSVERLRHARLLVDEDCSNRQSLDAHPLVREHFARELVNKHSEASKEAHRRIYEHLTSSAAELPATINDIIPLYHAIAHGCKGGLHRRTYLDLYCPRIRRSKDESSSFAINSLGAFGADLAALVHFFDRIWDQPNEHFLSHEKAELLGTVGFRLYGLGRLQESTSPLENALTLGIYQADWLQSAIRAIDLSEVCLLLGKVAQAVSYAEESIELAYQSCDSYWQVVATAVLGDVLHQAGRRTESLEAFQSAEELQRVSDGELPLLHSFHGFKYCDLLLDEEDMSSATQDRTTDAYVAQQVARCYEVRQRAEATMDRNRNSSLFAYGLTYLTVGKSYLIEARYCLRSVAPGQAKSNMSDTMATLRSAEFNLSKAVLLIRQAGAIVHLPRALLARSMLWRTFDECRQFEGASSLQFRGLALADIIEIETIARRNGIVIWEIDVGIERVQLHLLQNDIFAAKCRLGETKRMIERTRQCYAPRDSRCPTQEASSLDGVFQSGESVGYDRWQSVIEALERSCECG